MSENFSSNNIKNDKNNLNLEDCDYDNLITRLRDIKTYDFIGKNIIKRNLIFLIKTNPNKKLILLKRQPLVLLIFSSISFY